MRAIVLFALCFVVTGAVTKTPHRIVGGSVTTIDQYPSMACLLNSWESTFWQACGGVILNMRSVLTAAHCPDGDNTSAWRVRVGSTWPNSGGVVHTLRWYIIHGSYDARTMDNDIAIMRVADNFAYNNQVGPASIAGPNYYPGDNQVVWAAGWGATFEGGSTSDQLRHVQIWTVNQNVCAQRYATVGDTITDNMLCSGWLDVGGRDQCQGDDGGPLYHNGVAFGICSWSRGCGLAFFPSVNTRVSRYTDWILSNT